MILEKEYAAFYWLECDLTKEEFSAFVQNLDQVNTEHKINLIDGVDEETQSICFKFNQCKATKQNEIKWAKTENLKHCNKFMQLLSKKIDGRLYFNVNHNVIKKK